MLLFMSASSATRLISFNRSMPQSAVRSIIFWSATVGLSAIRNPLRLRAAVLATAPAMVDQVVVAESGGVLGGMAVGAVTGGVAITGISAVGVPTGGVTVGGGTVVAAGIEAVSAAAS
jgi:hypothetical protein